MIDYVSVPGSKDLCVVLSKSHDSLFVLSALAFMASCLHITKSSLFSFDLILILAYMLGKCSGSHPCLRLALFPCARYMSEEFKISCSNKFLRMFAECTVDEAQLLQCKVLECEECKITARQFTGKRMKLTFPDLVTIKHLEYSE